MKAGDVMTTNVVAVAPESPARSIALLLFRNGISAVPVVDEHGAPVGMVSEGDLMPRDESEREARRDWWLKLLAEGEDLNSEFMAHLQLQDRSAREIMAAPVTTVTADADVVEVAELLSSERIKRAPVMHDGRMVGIISRADLVKALAQPARTPESEPALGRDSEIFAPSEWLLALTRRQQPDTPAHELLPHGELSAQAFRGLVARFEEEEAARRKEAQHQTVERHHQDACRLLATQLSDAAWERMLNEARLAARTGREEHLLIRFPSGLCTDHGRAVNAPDPIWPATLRGLAAQIFVRWKRELRSHGFGLHARVIEFPDGLPGDIGLYLAWER
jgi:CBS domain-containing protein